MPSKLNAMNALLKTKKAETFVSAFYLYPLQFHSRTLSTKT